MSDVRAKQTSTVDWKEAGPAGGRQFATGIHHQIAVKRETIPIVFVPGIMGSRLRSGDGSLVWDPSHPAGFMLPVYGPISPLQRKRMLILDKGVDVLRWGQNAQDDATFASEVNSALNISTVQFNWDWLPPVALDYSKLITQTQDSDSEESGADVMIKQFFDKLAPILGQQGWSEISFGDYLPLLFKLSNHDALGDYAKYFLCPVYAFGYNFFEDNKIGGAALAARIAQIIAQENGRVGTYCTKVILISHSMGGILTRSAMQISGAGGQVLGVIHGAQPVTGAPAAYRRMRAGTDGFFLTGDVLGRHAKDVVPILANTVGGLELLPTSYYVDRAGNGKWLSRFGPTGAVESEFKPLTDNPYHELYADTDQTHFLRLLFDPNYLMPEGMPASKAGGLPSSGDPMKKGGTNVSTAPSPLQSYVTNVSAAYQFQLVITPHVHHPNTYHGYSTGLPTYEHVRFNYKGPWTKKGAPPHGEGDDFDPAYAHGTGAVFTIAAPDPGAGDGTVPVSSGSALKLPKERTFTLKDVAHQDFFAGKDSLDHTIHAIQTILDDHKKQQGK